uniref:Uncharacterized protein n=1 Tax=Meloidogyne javanica TaxID=6303 RepID=A0A915MY04_MELJA
MSSIDEASDKTLNLFPIHGDNQVNYGSEPIRDWDEMRDQHDALYQYYLNQQQEFDSNYVSNPTGYGSSYHSTQIGTSGHGENISNPVHDSAHYAKLYKDSQAEGKVDQNAIMQMYQRAMQQANEYIPNFDLGEDKKQEDSD